MVKQEHEDMSADLKSSLAWLCVDYMAREMERQRPALEEIAGRHRGRDLGRVVVLDDSDEVVTGRASRSTAAIQGRVAATPPRRTSRRATATTTTPVMTTPSFTTSSA